MGEQIRIVMTETWYESARGLVQRCIARGYIKPPEAPPLTDEEIKKVMSTSKEMRRREEAAPNG